MDNIYDPGKLLAKINCLVTMATKIQFNVCDREIGLKACQNVITSTGLQAIHTDYR